MRSSISVSWLRRMQCNSCVELQLQVSLPGRTVFGAGSQNKPFLESVGFVSIFYHSNKVTKTDSNNLECSTQNFCDDQRNCWKAWPCPLSKENRLWGQAILFRRATGGELDGLVLFLSQTVFNLSFYLICFLERLVIFYWILIFKSLKILIHVSSSRIFSCFHLSGC